MNQYAYPVIVLVTVNDNETHALLDAFVGEGLALTQVTKGGLTYNDLGIHGGYRLVHTVCEMGAGGIGASQQRTRDAIDHWQPQAVIAVGIAFGIDETKQAIGDVLVSTQIQDYELGRLNKDGTLTPRGDKPSSADILCNRFRQTNTNKSRSANDWPKVRFGLILSGQKLVDNLDYRESLKTLFTEAIGGEMEGVGLYVSASAAKVDWIVVKAICDWGHNKNQTDKDAKQKLAAKNAARVLKEALDNGGLYPSTPPDGKTVRAINTKSEHSENEFVQRDEDAISFLVVKRGAEPEVERPLLPDQKGLVTDTRNTGYPDPLVRETFIEFSLTKRLLNAEHVELCFKIENESAIAGSIGHYRGTGTFNPKQFGASTLITKFELTKDFFKIDITSIVKQYTKEGASFIGFRFYGSEGTTVSSKQFFVCGGHLEVSYGCGE